MDGAAQRAALADLARERGESLAALSRLIERNAAYLQQFVTRGSPRRLAERDRATLARYLGVEEARLGGPVPVGMTQVPRLDIRASAGPGAVVERELRRRPGTVDPALLRQLGVRREAASMIRVDGESMLPTLADGDEILVDGDRRRPASRAALYVLRIGGVLMVKRLRAGAGEIEVISDNPAFESRAYPADQVEVVGRVVWLARALL